MGVDDKELVILGGHGSKFRCIVTGSRCIKYYKGLSKYDKATVQSILIQVNGVFPHYGGMKRFKLFQDEVWEIKDIGSQIRIACF